MAIASTYPPGTSDGAEKYLGVQASDGAVKLYVRGSPQALMETRAAAMAATIDVAAKSLRTAGYAAPGDGGDALYKRLATAPTAPTNKAFFRSIDRYTASGASDATNGGYWELVPEGCEVRIEQFGGKADWTGTPGTSTDNFQPIRDAIDFTARVVSAQELFSNRIVIGIGSYYVSQTIDIHTHTWLRSICSGSSDHGPTELYFPHTVTCFIISQNNTVGDSASGSGLASGIFSTLEGLTIRHHYATGSFDAAGTPSNKHGIHMRGVATLIGLTLMQMSGNAISITGSSGTGGATEGAPNEWRIRNCSVHSAVGHALCVIGADANAGSCVGYSTQNGGVGGCGIYNDTYYANTYTGIHLAGYGNRGVRVGNVAGVSRIYQSIGGIGHPTTNPNTVTPGTNNAIWYDIGVYNGTGNHDARFPEWSAGGDYTSYHLPIWDSGGASIYTGVYVEGGGVLSHAPAPSIIFGGTMDATNYSNFVYGVGFLAGRQGVGGHQSFIEGTPEYAANGVGTWAAIGMGSEFANDGRTYGADGGIQFLTHSRIKDGSSSAQWGYRGSDIVYQYRNQTPFWEQTTPSTTRTFGRTLPQKHRLLFYDHFQEDPNSSGSGRMVGLRPSVPSGPGAVGEYARGDRFYNVNPSPGGYAGWICTTGGAIHNVVWSSGVLTGGGNYLRNSANRVYWTPNGGTSTVEPVHTSGTVTGADGVTWTWLANGPPVFKQFGTIEA